MNQLKKHLFTGAILLFILPVILVESLICAQSESIKQESLSDNDLSIKEFELLIIETLLAEKPSTQEMALWGGIREIVKILGTLGTFFWAEDSSCPLPEQALIALIILSPALSDLLIHKKDDSLIALQKLEKYIRSLKPSQKACVAKVFNEKYANNLSAKILQEEDSKKIKATKILINVVDLVILPLLWASLIYYAEKPLNLLALPPTVLNALVIGYNFYKSIHGSKAHLLEQIKNDLKQS